MQRILNFLSVFMMLSGSFLFISCEQEIDLDSEQVTNELPGLWLCRETEFKHAYELTLVKSRYRSNAIIIYNFYDLGETSQVEARIDGYKITLFEQSFAQDYTVTGTGYVSDDLTEISWRYEVNDGTGLIEQYDAVYTKSN